MEVKAAHLCDFASVREGMLTVVSAGVTRSFRPQAGLPLGVFLALVVEVSANERMAPHELHLRVVGPTDQLIGAIQGGFQVQSGDFDPGEAGVVNMAFDLRPFPAPVFGWYTVFVDIDSAQATSVRMKIVEGNAPQPVPPALAKKHRTN